MADPTGISSSEVRKTLAGLRALGEIMDVPTPRLDAILARARSELEELRGPPAPPTPPPTP